jgi:hypothetical protein
VIYRFFLVSVEPVLASLTVNYFPVPLPSPFPLFI